MDSYKIDTTKRIRDVFRTPIPRIDARIDMRYFTSGFIYLQDVIERAIVTHHTDREKLPGIYMQQFPSPCYVFDTFFIAISQLFPLFMILSFVYTCAMIVKSVVHEKERRLKETMRTMGLGNAVHWLAWFIDSMTFIVISCFGLSIILVVSCCLIALLQSSCWRRLTFDYCLIFQVRQSIRKVGPDAGFRFHLVLQCSHRLQKLPHLDFFQSSQFGSSLRRIYFLRLLPAV